ncbi:MAG TPA: SRPBCC family protein [Lacipirellulaceae bacterium]|nr:SRPBCC family protein [Lacipirellulaceae bacterium]
MLIKLVLIAVVLVVALSALVASRPAHFSLTRSTTIAAPPAAVFAYVNDFHKWVAWSPWERMDSQLQRTYEGAPQGVGAVYSWKGNKQVGAGRMTILESVREGLIRIRLEFLKPFQATNAAEFTFEPLPGAAVQTRVSWTMTGTNTFMFKAAGMVMNMDKLIGAQFEEGLANLKNVVESPR